MLPPDVIDALSKLRMDVPTHTMAHNEAVVLAATGRSIQDVFLFFDARPVASGTVAQVHLCDVSVCVCVCVCVCVSVCLCR